MLGSFLNGSSAGGARNRYQEILGDLSEILADLGPLAHLREPRAVHEVAHLVQRGAALGHHELEALLPQHVDELAVELVLSVPRAARDLSARLRAPATARASITRMLRQGCYDRDAILEGCCMNDH